MLLGAEQQGPRKQAAAVAGSAILSWALLRTTDRSKLSGNLQTLSAHVYGLSSQSQPLPALSCALLSQAEGKFREKARLSECRPGGLRGFCDVSRGGAMGGEHEERMLENGCPPCTLVMLIAPDWVFADASLICKVNCQVVLCFHVWLVLLGFLSHSSYASLVRVMFADWGLAATPRPLWVYASTIPLFCLSTSARKPYRRSMIMLV